jgi:hypothetical protein
MFIKTIGILFCLFFVYSNTFGAIATFDSLKGLIKSNYCIGYILSNHIDGQQQRDLSEGAEIHRSAINENMGLAYSITEAEWSSDGTKVKWCGEEQYRDAESSIPFLTQKRLEPAAIKIYSGENKVKIIICLFKTSINKKGAVSVNECDHLELSTTLIFTSESPNNISFNMNKYASLALDDFAKTKNSSITFYPDQFNSFAKQSSGQEMKLLKAYFTVEPYDSGRVHGLKIKEARYYLDGEQLFWKTCGDDDLGFNVKPFYNSSIVPWLRSFPFWECSPGQHTIKLELASEQTSFPFEKTFNAIGDKEIQISTNFLISDTIPSSKLKLVPFDNINNGVKNLENQEKNKLALQQQKESENEKQQEIPNLANAICTVINTIAMDDKAIQKEKRIAQESGVENMKKIYDITNSKSYMQDQLKQMLARYYSKTAKQFDTNNCTH